MRRRIVTIDGPAGVGKSTVSRWCAAELGFTYLDTGAMYRGVGLFMKERGVAFTDDSVAPRLADVELELLPAAKEGDTRVLLCGREVTEEIRTPEMSMVASEVSALPSVRTFLTGLQRQFGEKEALVAEGRDMGTVVFPTAAWKFFLDADADIRTLRRQKQMAAKGKQIDFDRLLAMTVKRDREDRNRRVAPLKAAEDARLIDTGPMTAQEVTAMIVAVVRADPV